MSRLESEFSGSSKFITMTPIGEGYSSHAIPDDDHSRTYCGKTVEGHWREVATMPNCNRCRITIRKMKRSAIL